MHVGGTLTGGVSIFQVTNALAFMVPVGFSVAVLTRSSNELGAGRPAHARHAGKVAFAMILVVEAVVSVVILVARFHWARLYTDDDRIVRLVSRLLVPLAVYTAFDGVLCVATVRAHHGSKPRRVETAYRVDRLRCRGLGHGLWISQSRVEGLGFGYHGRSNPIVVMCWDDMQAQWPWVVGTRPSKKLWSFNLVCSSLKLKVLRGANTQPPFRVIDAP